MGISNCQGLWATSGCWWTRTSGTRRACTKCRSSASSPSKWTRPCRGKKTSPWKTSRRTQTARQTRNRTGGPSSSPSTTTRGRRCSSSYILSPSRPSARTIKRSSLSIASKSWSPRSAVLGSVVSYKTRLVSRRRTWRLTSKR